MCPRSSSSLKGALLVRLFISEPQMGFDLDLSAGRQRSTGTSPILSKPRTSVN